VILPTIHLNGTDPQALREGYVAAAEAVRAAISALEAVPLNGRDYYPQGDAAYGVAFREHGNRVWALTEVYREMHQIIDHIDEAIEARRR